jgi:hypothetical protein
MVSYIKGGTQTMVFESRTLRRIFRIKKGGEWGVEKAPC